MKGTNSNAVSLAGEFAVLSQLVIRGYDANMTLGHTKGVDILVSNPKNGRMLKVEVKTNFRSSRSSGGNSKIFGKFLSAWMMGNKHETICDPNLFYCFVNINEDMRSFRFFIVPSRIVSDYIKIEHKHWLEYDEKHRDTTIRNFRIGNKGENYPIPTPTAEEYENNWEFKP